MDRVYPIRGIIGMDVTLDGFTSMLGEITPEDNVIFDISSPGGSVIVGLEIYNAVKELKAKKITFRINGLAASIASIIVMAGDEIEASEFSMFMIHKASTGIEGNSTELQQQVEILEKIDELLVNTYHARNQSKGTKKLSDKAIKDMIAKETWLSPAEALEYGFIDKVINQAADVKAAALTNFNMNHLQKLRSLLNSGGKPQITAEDVEAAIAQSLDGKKFTSLNEEEVQNFLVAVKGSLETKAGGTLTDEETESINDQLNKSVEALTEKERGETAEGQIEQLSASIKQLTDMVKTMGEAVVKNGQDTENLAFELQAVKKNARTFGKKAFVNETTKLNIGSAYVDPYAKHRQEMAAIDQKNNRK